MAAARTHMPESTLSGISERFTCRPSRLPGISRRLEVGFSNLTCYPHQGGLYRRVVQTKLTVIV